MPRTLPTPASFHLLTERDQALARALAGGAPWKPATFIAVGFSPRSAGQRAWEYRTSATHAGFRQVVDDLQFETRLTAAPELWSDLLALTKSKDEKVRLKAITEAMNRIGLVPGKKIEHRVVNDFEGVSDSELLAFIKAQLVATKIIDVTPNDQPADQLVMIEQRRHDPLAEIADVLGPPPEKDEAA